MMDVETIHQIIFRHVYDTAARAVNPEFIHGPLWRATEEAAKEIRSALKTGHSETEA